MFTLRWHANARLTLMWGIFVNERVVWYSEKYSKAEPEEHRDIKKVLLDIGLKITSCEDIEDLQSILERMEPILLLVETKKSKGWPGWNRINSLKKEGKFIPVMVISKDSSGEDAVWTFKSGGNEYMSHPINIEEFRGRVFNLLELTGKRRGLNHILKIDGLILDPSRRYITREGKELELTPKEFELLHFLAINLGNICSRGEILKKVWGYDFDTSTNVVDVYIRHLRAKVDKGYRNKLIHTVRGTGYVMRAPRIDATC